MWLYNKIITKLPKAAQITLLSIPIFAIGTWFSYIISLRPEVNGYKLGFPYMFYNQFQVDLGFMNSGGNFENLIIDILVALLVGYFLYKAWKKIRKKRLIDNNELSNHLIN